MTGRVLWTLGLRTMADAPKLNPQKPDGNATSFTVDSDSTGLAEMPSITQLLNRKKLGISKGSKKSTPPNPDTEPLTIPPPPPAIPESISPPQYVPEAPSIDAPPPYLGSPSISVSETSAPAAPPAPVSLSTPAGSFQLESTVRPNDSALPSKGLQPTPLEVETSQPRTVSPAEVKVTRAARRGERAVPELAVWDLSQLRGGQDPLGKSLVQLFDQKSASCALFLSISPPPPGSPVPHFLASAAVLPKQKLALWAGLKWDPTVVPELWNYFIRAGHVELSPPGTMTNVTSTRNVVRGAFGIDKNEWLTLVRVGPAESCRGVVALISSKGILGQVQAILPQLSGKKAA